jgi:hypothetical protein
MGLVTFLVGGGWWGLLFVDVLSHEPTRRLKEVALMTAVMTTIFLIMPTVVLTNKARSSGGGGMWFNRIVLMLVSGVMAYMAVISLF